MANSKIDLVESVRRLMFSMSNMTGHTKQDSLLIVTLPKKTVDTVYSGVVSLSSPSLVIFLAELNQLELWGSDIGNAYLEAKTKEKLFIIAGPEFGNLQGLLLVMKKALYGTRSAGDRWHD